MHDTQLEDPAFGHYALPPLLAALRRYANNRGGALY